MASMLMAVANGQNIDELSLQELDAQVHWAGPSESRVGTPVPRAVRKAIQGGPRPRPRTAKQLVAAVASSTQKLTSHAMHLARELKVCI